MSERDDENREKNEIERWPLRFREPEIPEDEPFRNDALDRKKYADLLTQLLRRTETPLVLGLDSDWGTGKTTFAKMWRQQLELDGFKTLYFNAWETDYVAEPLVALVGELDIARQGKGEAQYRRVKKVTGEVLRKGVPLAIRLLTSGLIDIRKEDVEDALGDLAEHAAKESIDSYLAQKSELAEFRKALKDLLEEISDDRPLVFFIDELDRCRPTFAVELLERIKHLFEVEGMVFVLVMHREQLAHSVRGFYGGEFDAGAYLRRFLDLTYSLPKPARQDFGRHLVVKLNLAQLGLGDWQMLLFLMEYLGFSLRQQQRCALRAALSVRSLEGDEMDSNPLLPALVVLAEWKPELFRRFASDFLVVDAVLEALEDVNRSRWGFERPAIKLEAFLLAFYTISCSEEASGDKLPPSSRLVAYRLEAEDGSDRSQVIIREYERLLNHASLSYKYFAMKKYFRAVAFTADLRAEFAEPGPQV